MQSRTRFALALLVATYASGPALAATATLYLTAKFEDTCDVDLRSGQAGRPGRVGPLAGAQTVAELTVDCASNRFDISVSSDVTGAAPSRADFALISASTDSLVRYALRLIGQGGNELVNTLENDFSARNVDNANASVLDVDISFVGDAAAEADSGEYPDTVVFTVSALGG